MYLIHKHDCTKINVLFNWRDLSNMKLLVYNIDQIIASNMFCIQKSWNLPMFPIYWIENYCMKPFNLPIQAPGSLLLLSDIQVEIELPGANSCTILANEKWINLKLLVSFNYFNSSSLKSKITKAKAKMQNLSQGLKIFKNFHQ